MLSLLCHLCYSYYQSPSGTILPALYETTVRQRYIPVSLELWLSRYESYGSSRSEQEQLCQRFCNYNLVLEIGPTVEPLY